MMSEEKGAVVETNELGYPMDRCMASVAISKHSWLVCQAPEGHHGDHTMKWTGHRLLTPWSNPSSRKLSHGDEVVVSVSWPAVNEKKVTDDT